MSAKKRRRSQKSSDPGRVKLYADENVDPYLIDFLRDAKVNVQSAVELGFSGRGDRFHFAEAKRLGRSLLTHDRDYLDHSKFPFNQMRGVVILGAQPDHDSMRWLVQWLIGDVVPSGKEVDGTKIVLHRDTVDIHWIDHTGAIKKQVMHPRQRELESE